MMSQIFAAIMGSILKDRWTVGPGWIAVCYTLISCQITSHLELDVGGARSQVRQASSLPKCLRILKSFGKRHGKITGQDFEYECID